MSRFSPHHDTVAETLAAAAKWRQRCLIDNQSVFSTTPIWNLENLDALRRFFINSPDVSKKKFIVKLKGQLANAPDDAKKLAAELLWMIHLFPSNIRARTKRLSIVDVWSKSGGELNDSNEFLSDPVLAGIGNSGQGYSQHRPSELRFAINTFSALFELKKSDRETLFEDPWRFANWLEEVPDEGDRQLRHIIPYLLFPDSFERISSSRHFREILIRLAGLEEAHVKKMTKVGMDEAVFALRQKLEAEAGGPIDFYQEDIFEQWREYLPDWSRDELIIVLQLYFKHRASPPGKASATVMEISEFLRRMAELTGAKIDRKFRNPNGIYLKMMNFRAIDPEYIFEGKVGMKSGAALDKIIWDEFFSRTDELDMAADSIRAIVTTPGLSSLIKGAKDTPDEAQEGGIRYRWHKAYERSLPLAKKKRKAAGASPVCEGCGFCYAQFYGDHGAGYIEVHHLQPVHRIQKDVKTRLEDLALLCANCHRMMHRKRDLNMTLAELRELVTDR